MEDNQILMIDYRIVSEKTLGQSSDELLRERLKPMTQFKASYLARSLNATFGEKGVAVKYKGNSKFDSVQTGEVHEEVLDILSKFELEFLSNSVYKIVWQEPTKSKHEEDEKNCSEQKSGVTGELCDWEMDLEIHQLQEYEPVKFDLNTEDREKWA